MNGDPLSKEEALLAMRQGEELINGIDEDIQYKWKDGHVVRYTIDLQLRPTEYLYKVPVENEFVFNPPVLFRRNGFGWINDTGYEQKKKEELTWYLDETGWPWGIDFNKTEFTIDYYKGRLKTVICGSIPQGKSLPRWKETTLSSIQVQIEQARQRLRNNEIGPDPCVNVYQGIYWYSDNDGNGFYAGSDKKGKYYHISSSGEIEKTNEAVDLYWGGASAQEIWTLIMTRKNRRN